MSWLIPFFIEIDHPLPAAEPPKSAASSSITADATTKEKSPHLVWPQSTCARDCQQWLNNCHQWNGEWENHAVATVRFINKMIWVLLLLIFLNFSLKSNFNLKVNVFNILYCYRQVKSYQPIQSMHLLRRM